jgi:hypothetical protein
MPGLAARCRSTAWPTIRTVSSARLVLTGREPAGLHRPGHSRLTGLSCGAQGARA